MGRWWRHLRVLFLKEVNGVTKERRITKMLGKDYLLGENVPMLLNDLIIDLNNQEAQKALKQRGVTS